MYVSCAMMALGADEMIGPQDEEDVHGQGWEDGEEDADDDENCYRWR